MSIFKFCLVALIYQEPSHDNQTIPLKSIISLQGTKQLKGGASFYLTLHSLAECLTHFGSLINVHKAEVKKVRTKRNS